MGESDATSFQEKVDLYGMEKSRWRCPECHRAVHFSDEGKPYCVVDGEVKPVDLTAAPTDVREKAIDLGLWSYLGEYDELPDTLTTEEIAEDTGIDKEYLEDFLQRQPPASPHEADTYKEDYEETYDIDIRREERGKGWKHVRQKKLAQEKGETEQTMFPGTTPKEQKEKQRPPPSQEQKETKKQPLEKYGAEVREPGQPKIQEFTEEGKGKEWTKYVNNLWRNDIGFLKGLRMDKTEDADMEDFDRIKEDIETHEDIVMRDASEEDKKEAEAGIHDIKYAFNRELGYQAQRFLDNIGDNPQVRTNMNVKEKLSLDKKAKGGFAVCMNGEVSPLWTTGEITRRNASFCRDQDSHLLFDIHTAPDKDIRVRDLIETARATGQYGYRCNTDGEQIRCQRPSADAWDDMQELKGESPSSPGYQYHVDEIATEIKDHWTYSDPTEADMETLETRVER